VLVAGATGYIGRYVVREFVRRGEEVIALVRGGTGSGPGGTADGDRFPPGVSVLAAPVTDREALLEAVAGERIDAVVSCIASRSGEPADAWRVECEGNRNLLALAQAHGARHFVLLSAICVQRPRLAFQHAKLAFEADLAASGMRYSIVRPTAFFKSLAGQIERVRAGKPFLVFGRGTETACKPIGEADLARYLADCLDDPTRCDRILPVGGPGPAITPREQGEMLCELAERPVRIQGVTPKLFDAVIAVLAPLSRIFPGLAGKAEFARIGRYYATESMLLWDESRQAYDAEATPAFGTETLRDFYTRVLREGLEGQELGEHKMF
jgi:divinyl chlorophyllide a 8-vinyl-reductase